jgi:SAM-dependent methyltransferase
MRIWSTLFPWGKSPGLVVAGCGTGDLIAEFANSHPRVQFVEMDFSEAIYENAREHAKTTNIDWICDDVINAKQDFSVALSVTSRDSESKVLEFLLPSSRLVVPLHRTPPPSRLLVALLRVFLFHTLLRGRALYMALHLCYLMTLLTSTKISILRVK